MCKETVDYALVFTRRNESLVGNCFEKGVNEFKSSFARDIEHNDVLVCVHVEGVLDVGVDGPDEDALAVLNEEVGHSAFAGS